MKTLKVGIDSKSVLRRMKLISSIACPSNIACWLPTQPCANSIKVSNNYHTAILEGIHQINHESAKETKYLESDGKEYRNQASKQMQID